MKRMLPFVAIVALCLSLVGCEEVHDTTLSWEYTSTPWKRIDQARIVEVYDSVFLHSGHEYQGNRRVVMRDVDEATANAEARSLFMAAGRVLDTEGPYYDIEAWFEVTAYVHWGNKKTAVATRRYGR